ncbi:MAG: protein-glutamate O-methyltransferase CheR [Nitrospirae bacterium]|nr:MAG: protein-glutamate O-methyltransferase CheR [Nitrospirota bacterium]
MDSGPFKELLKERCGLHFEEVRTAKLESAVYARMSDSCILSAAEYFQKVLKDTDEFNKLVNMVTINETYFLRERDHLKILVDRLVPELIGASPNQKIRILIAGCSTGEEPYSIMIELFEKYRNSASELVSVMAFDIDSDAVAKAMEGVYGPSSFRNMHDNIRDRYFDPVGENVFRIKDFIREPVSFRTANLYEEEFPEEFCSVDIIFYRNVSIYFDPDTQKEIFTNLARLLKKGGYLFVSATETFSHNIGVLILVEFDGSFLYHKGDIIAIEDRRQLSGSGPGPVCRTVPEKDGFSVDRLSATLHQFAGKFCPDKRASHELFDKAMSLAKDKQYEKSLAELDLLIRDEPSFVKAYILKASVLINMKRPDEACDICLKCIDFEKWCLEAYLLLGFIAKIKNENDTAIRRFKDALYIESSCWLAHFYLAEIYNLIGEKSNSCREYEITEKLLEKGDTDEHGITYFPIYFDRTQMTHLCRHNIRKLKGIQAA